MLILLFRLVVRPPVDVLTIGLWQELQLVAESKTFFHLQPRTCNKSKSGCQPSPSTRAHMGLDHVSAEV